MTAYHPAVINIIAFFVGQALVKKHTLRRPAASTAAQA
jgi:hypothetical protein